MPPTLSLPLQYFFVLASFVFGTLAFLLACAKAEAESLADSTLDQETAHALYLEQLRDHFVTRTKHHLQWPTSYSYEFFDRYVRGDIDEMVRQAQQQIEQRAEQQKRRAEHFWLN